MTSRFDNQNGAGDRRQRQPRPFVARTGRRPALRLPGLSATARQVSDVPARPR